MKNLATFTLKLNVHVIVLPGRTNVPMTIPLGVGVGEGEGDGVI